MKSRRQVLRRAAAISAGGAITTAAPIQGATAGQALKTRGICYDTGTNYLGSPPARVTWRAEIVERDMTAIAGQLHCNAVSILGTEVSRLQDAGVAAAEHGMQVWLQPRLTEAPKAQILDHLAEAARVAEALRKNGADTTLNLGCELTLLAPGFGPGATLFDRITAFGQMTPADFDQLNAALNEYLANARTIARSLFSGPITYSAGPWESVDWRAFDLVGIDHYRDSTNHATYADDLRAYRRFGKPVVVTEFGCCTFRGAEDAGGDGWTIVDYEGETPILNDDYVRDERIQARTILELLDIFEATDVRGAFVYQFIDLSTPHVADPKYDLDMASYAIVKVTPETVDGSAWQPKEAFHALGKRYAAG